MGNWVILEFVHGKLGDFGTVVIASPNYGERLGNWQYMAPEAFRGALMVGYSPKIDVYSFGIVLWEIITGQEPFLHHDNYQVFKESITKKNERPPIPSETHPSLKSLMEVCWQADTSKRPSFTQIIPILDSVLVDCLVADIEGNKFWKKNFLGKDHVDWNEFQSKLSELLRLQPNPKDLNFACLRKILASPNKDPNGKDPDICQLEKFGHLLDWFGPIVIEHKGFSLLDKIRVLMQKEWFHGDISKETSEDLLSGQPKGTFLVRTSITERSSPFTISKVTKKGKINHQRIQKRQDGKFEVNIIYSNGKSAIEVSKDDLLVPFIRSLSSELYLENSCPGSKYKALFLQTKVEGYLQQTGDD